MTLTKPHKINIFNFIRGNIIRIKQVRKPKNPANEVFDFRKSRKSERKVWKPIKKQFMMVTVSLALFSFAGFSATTASANEVEWTARTVEQVKQDVKQTIKVYKSTQLNGETHYQ